MSVMSAAGVDICTQAALDKQIQEGCVHRKGLQQAAGSRQHQQQAAASAAGSRQQQQKQLLQQHQQHATGRRQQLQQAAVGRTSKKTWLSRSKHQYLHGRGHRWGCFRRV